MKRLFAEIPDAAIRVAVWIVVIPVATVAVAPEWLDLPGGELETLVVQKCRVSAKGLAQLKKRFGKGVKV